MASELHLNFIPTSGDIPPIGIFRRLRKASEKIPHGDSLFGCRLPLKVTSEPEWLQYVVSFNPRDGFDAFAIGPGAPVHLVQRAMIEGLSARCHQLGTGLQWHLASDSFLSEAIFPVGLHPEGEEEIVLQPYFLGATKQHGFASAKA